MPFVEKVNGSKIQAKFMTLKNLICYCSVEANIYLGFIIELHIPYIVMCLIVLQVVSKCSMLKKRNVYSPRRFLLAILIKIHMDG